MIIIILERKVPTLRIGLLRDKFFDSLINDELGLLVLHAISKGKSTVREIIEEIHKIYMRIPYSTIYRRIIRLEQNSLVRKTSRRNYDVTVNIVLPFLTTKHDGKVLAEINVKKILILYRSTGLILYVANDGLLVRFDDEEIIIRGLVDLLRSQFREKPRGLSIIELMDSLILKVSSILT